jgi:4-hydroxymandelate oxidase
MSATLTRRQALLSGARAAVGISSLSAFAGTSQDARKESTASTGKQEPPPLSVGEYEDLALKRMSHVAWEYFTSGSADEITLRWNREAYQRLRLKPRVLVDVSEVDTRIHLWGQEMTHPILLAPTSTHFLAHPEGEVATVRGAGAADANHGR